MTKGLINSIIKDLNMLGLKTINLSNTTSNRISKIVCNNPIIRQYPSLINLFLLYSVGSTEDKEL